MLRPLVITLVIFSHFAALAQIPAIKVDQIGYFPTANKIAVLSDPITGYNSADSYTPSTTLNVKNADTDAIVWSATPTAWNNGNTHITSGDRVWWFDFSALTVPGEYYIEDPGNSITSDVFKIDAYVYNEMHQLAFKTFYYQRCGAAKETPYCLPGYADGACHLGALQDLNCRSILAPTAASELDLSGGWHDAGDYNKYVNFLWGTMIDMLLAYEHNPQAWSDDMDIPESGNYIPDILDEIKFETDWLLKMQQADGGVLCVVGVPSGGASPPSADATQRYYGPKTSSASFTAATIFALAAVQFEAVNCAEAQAYASILETAAINAYSWAIANPDESYFNGGNVAAGEQEVDAYGKDMRQLTAAIFLYAKTGIVAYKTYVENNYADSHMMQWGYVYAFEAAIQQALLYYAHETGVSPGVSSAIIGAYKNSMDLSADNFPAYTNQQDAYRAFLADVNYGWGSNGVKMAKGNMFRNYDHYALDPAQQSALTIITNDYLHYLHGVNPLGLLYLTNMNDFEAERSVNSIYHGWFDDGSALWDEVGVSTYGPAPGFLPGGPNPFWSLDACCDTDCGSTQNNSLCQLLSPPANQPILKSYLDWNTTWPQNSWEVTENAIYYQAAYLNLLSAKVDNSPAPISANEITRISNADLYLPAASKGIILKSENDNSFLISVNNSGKLITNPIAPQLAQTSRLEQSHVSISSANKGIIFRSADGNHWKLSIDNMGKTSVGNITSLPSSKVSPTTGHFIISDAGKGLILKNSAGGCFLLKVNDAGSLITIEVVCP